jgi:hypothetical protein
MDGDVDRLENLLRDGTDEERIAGLKEMRDNISDGQPTRFFDIARRLVGSENNDVRWQSIIVIGEFIPCGQRNEEIWRLILDHCGMDDDMKGALATVLLEHLLEYDSDRTLDRIRVELRTGNAQLPALLWRCSRFGQSDAKWHEFQQLTHGEDAGRA